MVQFEQRTEVLHKPQSYKKFWTKNQRLFEEEEESILEIWSKL